MPMSCFWRIMFTMFCCVGSDSFCLWATEKDIFFSGCSLSVFCFRGRGVRYFTRPGTFILTLPITKQTTDSHFQATFRYVCLNQTDPENVYTAVRNNFVKKQTSVWKFSSKRRRKFPKSFNIELQCYNTTFNQFCFSSLLMIVVNFQQKSGISNCFLTVCCPDYWLTYVVVIEFVSNWDTMSCWNIKF